MNEEKPPYSDEDIDRIADAILKRMSTTIAETVGNSFIRKITWLIVWGGIALLAWITVKDLPDALRTGVK